MRSKLEFISKKSLFRAVFLFVLVGYFQTIPHSFAQETETLDYVQIRGSVVDGKTKKHLEFASLIVNESNISTISNTDGDFLLKIPKNSMNKSLRVSYLGYKNVTIPLSGLSSNKNVIKLYESVQNLPEIDVISKDPDQIIRKVMEKKQYNYFKKPLLMKAFYRESIKKRKTYASLSEAVVDVYKQSYSSRGYDYVKLNKARKSTNYKKIDTLVIKLQGGPYNTLNIDLMKNRDIFFNEDVFEKYNFSFEKVLNIDNRPTYVLNFRPNNPLSEPLYYGKLYIDIQSYALSKAIFSLNLDDSKNASRYFVKRKPSKADVTPTVANYRVDYRVKDGKWYYTYSRIELTFKIDWKKKLFNSFYNIMIEMAITDWKINTENVDLKNKEKLKSNVILNDRASGFSNPEFWGEYNVIEPDKSIENAIKKIQRRLKN